MRPADLARLLALAAIWGASYLFMRIAVPHVGAEWMAEGRTLAGGLVMAGFLAATRTPIPLGRHWRGFLVLGVVAVAVPFWLIGTAVRTIDASTAAILNATSPIFSALVAAAWIRERLTFAKLAGIALSMAGIAILVGWTPRPMGADELLACSLSLAACACYGFASVYTKVRLHGASPAALSTASCLVAAAAIAPFTPWEVLASPVPPAAWAAIAILGVACTGFAFILYYRLIADLGPVRATTVTLLIPVFGIAWGVIFLGEPLTPGRIAGAATVLAGCALALGVVRIPLRAGRGTGGAPGGSG